MLQQAGQAYTPSPHASAGSSVPSGSRQRMSQLLTEPAHCTSPLIIETSQFDASAQLTAQSAPQSTRQLLTRAHSTPQSSPQPRSQFEVSVQLVMHASPQLPEQVLTSWQVTSQGSSAHT